MKRLLVLTALVLVAYAGTSAQGAGGKAVSIRDLAFHPGTLTVPKGSQVTFSNSDGVAHTAARETPSSREATAAAAPRSSA